MSDRRASWLVLLLVLLLAALGCAQEPAPEGGEAGAEEYGEAMAREHEGDEPVPGAAGGETTQGVATREVSYGSVEGSEIVGFLAEPEEGAEGAPGVVVIHEWWGLNDNIREMTRRLAGQGYRALAVDVYGGETASEPDAARAMMQEAMEKREAVLTNLEAAFAYLESELGVERAGVIGWCFGGAWSLEAALNFPQQVDAAVVYYGRTVQEDERLAKLDAPLLGIFGAEDQGIPVEDVRAMESTLEELDKDVAIHVYEGAGHAFANPSGTRYVEEAAKDAWDKTIAFFDEHLKPGA